MEEVSFPMLVSPANPKEKSPVLAGKPTEVTGIFLHHTPVLLILTKCLLMPVS